MTRTPARPETERQVRLKPKLLFFFSRDSGRCRRTEAHIAQVLQRRGNHQTFDLVRVPVDQRPDLAERFRVDVVPALVVIDDRRVRARLVNPRGCRDVRTLLEPWLR